MSNDMWIGIICYCLAGFILYSLVGGPGLVQFGAVVTGLSASAIFLLWIVLAGFLCLVGTLAITTPGDDLDE